MVHAPREIAGHLPYQKAGTTCFSVKVPLKYGALMESVRSGYARCSTDGRNLTAQRWALARLGVDPERIYTDPVSERVHSNTLRASGFRCVAGAECGHAG